VTEPKHRGGVRDSQKFHPTRECYNHAVVSTLVPQI
jgi:hypothetical protein